jgi:CheY-like chemotaxis protein
MPEMDGYGFLHQLKTLQNLPPAKLKIHVLSSSLDPLDRRKIEKSQLTESFISKPLTAEILKQL